MQLTQRTALTMFTEAGFDSVTVDDIADEVGMAASTIYRHFSTKEGIVLWDEHDPEIDKALEVALKNEPPMAAIRRVFVEEVGGRYDADFAFQLSRIQFIYATEQIHAAAVEADFRTRDELTAGLRHFLGAKDRDAAPVIAGAALLALDVAMDRWQRLDGKRPLASLMSEAFDHLANLENFK